MDNCGVRYNSAGMGRWMGADEPFAGWDQDGPQSFNLYSYVENNPMSRVDVDGHNVRVCIDNGDGSETCVNLTDKAYADLHKNNNGEDGVNFPGGKFPNGDITCNGGQVCGSARYFEPSPQDVSSDFLNVYFLG